MVARLTVGDGAVVGAAVGAAVGVGAVVGAAVGAVTALGAALTSTVPAMVTLPPETMATLPPVLVKVAPLATVTLLADASVVALPVVFTLPATVTEPVPVVLPTVNDPAPDPASLASVVASTLRVGAVLLPVLAALDVLLAVPEAVEVPPAAAAAACFFFSSSLVEPSALADVVGAAGSTATVALTTCEVPLTEPLACTVRLAVLLLPLFTTGLAMLTLPELWIVTWVPSLRAALSDCELITL